MEATTVIIILVIAMVLTNILDSIFERLPLPLIQLAVGFLLGLFTENMPELEPEIFMALVIAPLLFRESEEADLLSLWRFKKQVFFMAFLLVFITVLGIGFAVNLLIPDLPLAACFALGAVLGPTDYVAVASLSSKVKLPDVLVTVLKGEALINDASGLISLQFAVAALLTGAFSVLRASGELVVLCVGGFLVGHAIIILKRLLTEMLRRMMIHYLDTYVLIELLLPFLSYVAAEFFGFSGILAAVTAGTLQALDFKKTGLFEAEVGNAEKTVWDMVSFILNALVFLMLGMQMPAALLHVWENPDYNKAFVVAVTVVTTLILYAVRFASISFFSEEVIGRGLRERLRNTLILTLAGVKGVVAIAAAISLPAFFAQKPLLMFIAAGTITLTLVLALFLLPFVTTESPEERSEANRAHIELLRDVVRQLRKKEGAHLGAVIVSYQKRIKELEYDSHEKDERKQMKSLRAYAGTVERAALAKRLAGKEIGRRVYRDYMEILSMTRRAEVAGVLSYSLAGLRRYLKYLLRSDKERAIGMSADAYRQKLRDLFWDLTDLIVKSFEDVRDRYSDRLIALFIEERVNLVGHLIDDAYAGTLRARLHEEYVDELLIGYEIERETIWDFLDEGKMTLSQANELRANVNKLESYTLADDQNDVMLKLISVMERQRREREEESRAERKRKAQKRKAQKAKDKRRA
ncbi:MAG: sodium:proton antiporter [Clostridiales Family XIII bacterium]|jgi:CPA1 family monovalent cation:H+ antiporter|nr:sodium:proton antiporter [Clostridiales Family XIII bacterium]